MRGRRAMLLSTVVTIAATVGVSFAVTNGFAADPPACTLAGTCGLAPDTANNREEPNFTVSYVVKASHVSFGVFLVGDGKLEGDAFGSLRPVNRPENEAETMRPQIVDNLIVIGYRSKTLAAVRGASFSRTNFGGIQNHLTLRVVVIKSVSAGCPIGRRGTISFAFPASDHPLIDLCGFNAYRANRVGLNSHTKITFVRNSD